MTQQAFDGMDRSTKITFVGMQLESFATDFKIGQEHEFKVRGRVVAAGEEEMKDGHRRNTVKVDVASVAGLSYDEPEPPDGADGITVFDGDEDEGDDE